MNVEQAITDALRGIEVKDVRHGGRHKFNIHPLRVSGQAGGTFEVRGQISHQLRFRPDDQVKFSIRSGPFSPIIDMSIKRGGLGRLLGADSEISDWIGKEIDGSWEGACRDIIVRIAARFKG